MNEWVRMPSFDRNKEAGSDRRASSKMAGKNEKSQILLRKARNQLFESPDVWNLSTGLSSLCRHQLPEFLQANTRELLGDILDLPPSKYFLFYLQGVLTNVICVPGEH